METVVDVGLQKLEMPVEKPGSVIAGRVAVVAPDVGAGKSEVVQSGVVWLRAASRVGPGAAIPTRVDVA